MIQTSEISNMMVLLQTGHASIYDVDPYGLGLLHVRVFVISNMGILMQY